MADRGVDEFYEFISKSLEEPGAFTPRPFYSPEADVLFFYARDLPSYAKRLNSFVTLILATEDDSLVGIKIKSVKRIVATLDKLEKAQQLELVVVDHKIKMGILLAIATAQPPEEPGLESYTSKLEEFENIEIDRGELCPA